MKPVRYCTLNGQRCEVVSLELLLVLNNAGRGFMTVIYDQPAASLRGASVQVDLGHNNEAWRWFTGYVERDQPAENGARRLFVREVAGVLDDRFPCSFQHPTLLTVLDALTRQSGVVFDVPAKAYASTPIAHFAHSGSGTQLLNLLGRSFSIPDCVWHPMPDGSVFVGSAADSRFAGMTLPSLPAEYMLGHSGGNEVTLTLLPTMRPGIRLPEGRITRVVARDEDMVITCEKVDADGRPVSASPLRRQLENQFPELASGALRPRLARIIAPTESSASGDVADPFRPRYAVDVQLLDEDGQDAPGMPVCQAVPLPVPLAGPEAGLFSYPPVGTLVEITLVEGRPDKPTIRQILPEGHSLPEVRPGEQLQQQRDGVSQRVTIDGSWLRETDQTIRENSAQREINSDQETRTTTTRETLVQASDTTTVLGSATLMAGQVMQLSDGDYSLGAGEQLLVKARALLEELETVATSISDSLTETVGGDVTRTVTGDSTATTLGRHSVSAPVVEINAGSLFMGRGGGRLRNGRLNLLTLLIEILELINQLAAHTASHNHPGTGMPTNAGELSGDAAQAQLLKQKYRDLIA